MIGHRIASAPMPPLTYSRQSDRTALAGRAATFESRFCLLVTPTTVSFSWPSEKTRSVGTDRIPNLAESDGLSSTLTFVTRRLPAFSRAISSSNGAIILHGPHQGAQKSTSTGTGDWTTARSKLSSLMLMGSDEFILSKFFTFAGIIIGLTSPIVNYQLSSAIRTLWYP